MKLKLGKSTRWDTAKGVLTDVLAKLPDDFNVGMRAYGHRYPSRSSQTCTDSELLIRPEPIGAARPHIASAVGRLQPRGETPLVYSVLQTVEDLKSSGGGSVIVVTDGEESCKGDPVTAAQRLKSSGVDVTVNIVGFTLGGKQVAGQMTTFAQATGGRYYSAQNGETLGRALLLAAIDKIPYSIVGSTGQEIARGFARGPATELTAGEYTVIVRVGGQRLDQVVRLTAGADVVLNVTLKDERLVFERSDATASHR